MIRSAVISDVEDIHQATILYSDKKIILPRSKYSLYSHLQCLYVAYKDDKFAGTAGLHVLDEQLVEIRSLVIHPDFQGHGIGRKIVEHTIQEAKRLGFKKVLSLTYETSFFSKCGFVHVDKSELSSKIWIDCVGCSKYNDCDENAMMHYI